MYAISWALCLHLYKLFTALDKPIVIQEQRFCNARKQLRTALVFTGYHRTQKHTNKLFDFVLYYSSSSQGHGIIFLLLLFFDFFACLSFCYTPSNISPNLFVFW